MIENFKAVFGEVKPVIGMVHLGALPGSPLKVDGNTWNPVDTARAAEFIRLARLAREH